MKNVVEMPATIPVNDYQEYLQRQGITEQDEIELGLVLMPRVKSRATLGYRLGCDGIIIPYPGETFVRVRCIGPIPHGYTGGKYMSPKGSGCAPPYLAPSITLDEWAEIKVSPERPVFITEGELKSWRGCRGGWPVVGIGGVSMHETLFTSGWDWRGRRVFIVFDKDSGYAPGDYKRSVKIQLGKLSAVLAQRGAVVKNCVLPGELEDKVGLDDYLRGGGSLETLASTSVDPEKWSQDMAYLLENCVLVVGTNLTHVYNIEDGSRKALADFHSAHCKRFVWADAGNGKQKKVELSKEWLVHDNRPTAISYCLDPTQPKGIVEGEGGQPMVNIWAPMPTFKERRDEVLPQWERFLKGLFGEEPIKTLGKDGTYSYIPAWRWVSIWVAHALNKPEERTTQAVMLTTRVKGIGKSVFGDIVRRLFGVHGVLFGEGRLVARFNSEAEQAVFGQTDELDVKFALRESAINELITAEVMMIEPKNKDAFALPNLCRRYLTTNASAPMRLSPGQRRILVLSPEITEAEAEGAWGEWLNTTVGNWKEDVGAQGSIRDWYDDIWEEYGANWDPKARIFETQASRDVSEASMTTIDIQVEEIVTWMRNNGGFGAVSGQNKRTQAKVCGEVSARVKALGGRVANRNVKDGKAVVVYTTWDLTGEQPWHRNENGNAICDTHIDTVRGAAHELWTHYQNFMQLQGYMLGIGR